MVEGQASPGRAAPVFGEVTNVILSPPESLKVTRRSRSRRSHQTRSIGFDSPNGECSGSADVPRLAGRLQVHVDSAATLRSGAVELCDQLGTLSHDALRERVELLASQASQLHAELHSEWRCLLLSTTDAAAAAAAAAALSAKRGSNGVLAIGTRERASSTDAEPAARQAAEASPVRAPPPPAGVAQVSWPVISAWDETAALPLQPLEPVAEADPTTDQDEDGSGGTGSEFAAERGSVTRGVDSGAARRWQLDGATAAAAITQPSTPHPRAHAALPANSPANFARPPPVSVPPHAPPCTPPAIRTAPAASTDWLLAGGAHGVGVRPATLGGACAGGALGAGGQNASACGGTVARSPFVPLTISASAVQRARASASAHTAAPARHFAYSLGGAGCTTPVAPPRTPQRSHALPSGTPGVGSAARAIASTAGAGEAPALPWGKSQAAAAHVQARMRGWLERRRWQPALRRLVKRAAVAAELVASEGRYRQSLSLLVESFLRPLESAGAAGERAARNIFANSRVLVNVSSLFLSALEPALLDLCPARAVAAALQAHVPLFKTYLPYVAALSRAQGALSRAREHAALGAIIREAEGKAGCTLDSLLIQPIQRVPRYRMLVERMLHLTVPGAAEYAQLQEVLLRVAELCAAVNDSAAEAQSCAKVAELSRELGLDERSALLPGGLAQPHRRFVREGMLLELPPAQPAQAPSGDVAANGAGGWAAAVGAAAAGVASGAAGRPVRMIMCNDILLIATPGMLGGFSVRDALSLAKARVRALAGPENEPGASAGSAGDGSGGAGGAQHAFELCVGRKARVFAAPTAEAKHAWVKALRKQVCVLLERFKARGRSLAFLPQNVAMLRQQLTAAESERAAVEAQVCQISEELCALETQVREDRQRRDAAEHEVGSTEEASSERLAALLQTVFEADLAISRAESHRSLLQSQIGHHVARLSQISEMLELTAAKHDSDSLLQFMLFSNQ